MLILTNVYSELPHELTLNEKNLANSESLEILTPVFES